jgi:hypothetical protein
MKYAPKYKTYEETTMIAAVFKRIKEKGAHTLD